jgi:hypothetical protein
VKLVQRYFSVFSLLSFLSLGTHLAAQQSNSKIGTLAANGLLQGFENPPQTAKLRCYWWWLNGFTTADTITRDLTEMKAKGYAGVILVDDMASAGAIIVPTGPAYGSPAWMALFKHALDLASHLGLEISLEITDGGNVGILGGPGVGPEDALKLLTYSRTQVAGASDGAVKLPGPPVEGGFYRQIAVLAYPLRHGAPLAGEPKSGRNSIQALQFKTASRQIGGDSMPVAGKVMPEAVATEGEEDTHLEDVVDLTAHTDADGTLNWKFGAGEWEVLRVGYTASKGKVTNNSGTGYAVDAMSAQAFDHYWDRVISPILTASKPYVGKSLLYVVTDSWESDGANWTQDFRKEFIRLRGYDPVPYMPVVAGRLVDTRETSNKFLADLRRTVADLITVNYYDHFAKRAAAYGLGTHPESGGPHGAPIDALETFRASSFPQTEFWAASPMHRTTDEDRFFVKEASSAAHIYGKKYVAAEGFSTINMSWSNSPGRNLKPTFDRALTEGLNRLFWHEFTSSPIEFGRPGIEYFADTHLDPNVTWWDQAGPVLLAMNRAQFLLQQGNPVADLLYYYGTEVPNFARLKVDDPAHVMQGYEYDVTDQDALLHRMLASGGVLRTPEGVRYQALALPTTRELALPDLTWIEQYVHEGGTVIGLQPAGPVGLIPPARMAEFKRIASTMWGDCSTVGSGFVRYGNGRIYCTQNSHQAFADLHIVPDFTYKSDDAKVAFDFVHRETKDAEIYFVRNENDAPAKATLRFRVKGRTPEFFDIDTGTSTPAMVYRESGEQTEVPLTVPALGSFFVIFEHVATAHATSLEREGKRVFPSLAQGMGVYTSANSGFDLHSAEPGKYVVKMSSGDEQTIEVAAPAKLPQLQEPWTVTFPPGWGAPPSVTMKSLQSWTDSKVAGVRYFSGTATYQNTITVDAESLNKSREIWLDLGDVREVATVLVNGRELQTLWHAPFSLRIDSALHAGSNELSIKVTNLWPNRIIGDLQLTEVIHYTKTNVDMYKPDSPLLPSGLLTPVTLHVEEEGNRQ